MAEAVARMARALAGDDGRAVEESPAGARLGATFAVTELAAYPRERTAARMHVWSMRARVAQAGDSTSSRSRSLRRPAKPTCSRKGVGRFGTIRWLVRSTSRARAARSATGPHCERGVGPWVSRGGSGLAGDTKMTNPAGIPRWA